MTKRNRHIEHRLKAHSPAPDHEVVKKSTKSTKAHRDWFVGRIPISDHAVVRFLEICGNIDMYQVRQAMIAEGRARAIQAQAYLKMPMSEFNNARLVVRDGVIVTVLRAKGK